MIKRLLALAVMALGAMAQNTVTLTAVAPAAVLGLGSGVVGTAGTTTACYWVVVDYVAGGVLSAAPTCPTNVPGTLNGSNYVLLTWQAANGIAVTYDVLKTTGPTPPIPGATVAITTGLTSPTYSDQGGGLSPYTLNPVAYPTSTAFVQLNNRDYNPPAFEYVGSNSLPIQGAFGYMVSKSTTAPIRLGGRNNPFTVDYTGAPYVTGPGGAVTAGAVVSTTINLTTAQVNAGTIIVPPVTGQTFKVQHVQLVALGGATAGCTLVEVTDTASSPVVAMSATVAALTQNTVVNEATASGVTLTGFAPTALTAAKGIQVIKTGSSCTTATSFNVIVYYTINS